MRINNESNSNEPTKKEIIEAIKELRLIDDNTMIRRLLLRLNMTEFQSVMPSKTGLGFTLQGLEFEDDNGAMQKFKCMFCVSREPDKEPSFAIYALPASIPTPIVKHIYDELIDVCIKRHGLQPSDGRIVEVKRNSTNN